LWVKPSGSKLWHLAYRFGGKQRKLAIGSCPRIGLKEVRAKREEVQKLLASGFDPSQQKRLVVIKHLPIARHKDVITIGGAILIVRSFS